MSVVPRQLTPWNLEDKPPLSGILHSHQYVFFKNKLWVSCGIRVKALMEPTVQAYGFGIGGQL